MIYILHISDLHFVSDNTVSNIIVEDELLRLANAKLAHVPSGKKLLIVTGDLHNFRDKDYLRAEKFLKALAKAMGIDMNKDVFVVPGNHDVGNDSTLKQLLEKKDVNWKSHIQYATAMLKEGDMSFIPERLPAFRPFSNFVRKLKIYGTAKDPDGPAKTYLRNWRGKLNILHLNTALIADGNTHRNQITDTGAVANSELWSGFDQEHTPTIAIGHHNYYELKPECRKELATIFSLKNVNAFLSGDTYQSKSNFEQQMIRLTSDHTQGIVIPNLAASRGVDDFFDDYPEISFCLHEWNETISQVKVEFWKWDKFSASFQVEGDLRKYVLLGAKHELENGQGTNSMPASLIESEKLDSELPEYLNHLLIHERNHHLNFNKMEEDGIDIRLFPRVKITKQFIAIGKIAESEDNLRVWDIIRYSWTMGKKRNIVIEGASGMGKTITLFSVANLVGDDIPPSVYVPMYRLIDETENCISIPQYLTGLSNKYGREILHLANGGWEKGPKLLILLDGFNEVPAFKRRKMLHVINDWLDCSGAQLIIATRPIENIKLGEELVDDPITITLEELSHDNIREYLGELTPPEQSPLWNVLTVPLFLNQYRKFANTKGFTNITIKPEKNEGTILWNLIQIDLYQHNSEEGMLWHAFACEYFLPYIAYSMEKDQRVIIERRQAFVLIKIVLESIDLTKLPHHITDILNDYRRRTLRDPDLSSVNWNDIILKNVGFLIEDKNCYHFIHQDYCDMFAGLYMVNQAEMMKDGDPLPEVWQRVANYNLVHYAADLMERDEVVRLWETNRNTFPTDNSSTYAILELLKRRTDIDDSTINFSGMDLRRLNLTYYLPKGKKNEKNMKLFRNAKMSEKTFLDSSTFRSPGHTGTVNCIGVIENGRCVSGSDDCALRIWDSNTGHCLRILQVEEIEKWIICLAILPDGRIVSGSYNGTIRVWDSNTGYCLRTLKGHTDQITCIGVLSKGLIVSGSYDSTLRIWNLDTGNCVNILHGHIYGIHCVAISQNGTIISGSSDNTLRVWDRVTGKCLKTLEGHTDWIRCLVAHPNGFIISGSYDGTLRMWDTISGKCVQSFKGHTECIRCLAIIPGGQQVVSGSSDHTLRVWDINTGQCLRILKGHEDEITCVAVLMDGRVVSGSSDCTLRVWDIDNEQCLQTMTGHVDWITCVTILPDLRVISGSIDNTLRVWDSTTGQCLWVLERYMNAFSSITLLPNGQVVSYSDDNILRVWDVATGRCLQTIVGNKSRFTCLAVHPGGLWIVCGSDDHTLQIWDTTTWQCMKVLEGQNSRCTRVAVHPDGRRVVSSSDDATLRVWDIDTGQCSRIMKGHTGWVNDVVFHPSGYLVSVSSDCTLLVWDIDTGQCLRRLEGHTKRVTCVIILSDGRVVSCSDDRTLRIWDITTGKCQHILKGHKGWVTCVVASPDGTWIVSGADDSTLRIWDTINGKCLNVLREHKDDITCEAVLPDGQQVVSGSSDHTLRVWDSFTGECLQILEGHTGSVSCLAVLPDGLIISGSDDNTLRVWNPKTGECLNVFETLEADVSNMDLSRAVLPAGLAKTLWQNGAIISDSDYERYVKLSSQQ